MLCREMYRCTNPMRRHVYMPSWSCAMMSWYGKCIRFIDILWGGSLLISLNVLFWVLLNRLWHTLSTRWNTERHHIIDVKWASWRLKSMSTQLFIKEPAHANNRWQMDSSHTEPVMWKRFQFMTSFFCFSTIPSYSNVLHTTITI